MKLQTVVAMINKAIGANGVVSQECKAVVQQYGQTIMELLLAEVNYFSDRCPLNHGKERIIFTVACIISPTGPTKEDLLPNWSVHL